jgi:hypothetical protein
VVVEKEHCDRSVCLSACLSVCLSDSAFFGIDHCKESCKCKRHEFLPESETKLWKDATDRQIDREGGGGGGGGERETREREKREKEGERDQVSVSLSSTHLGISVSSRSKLPLRRIDYLYRQVVPSEYT